MSLPKSFSLLTIGFVAGATTLAAGIWIGDNLSTTQSKSPSAHDTPSIPEAPSFAAAVRRAAPAVVNIYSLRSQPLGGQATNHGWARSYPGSSRDDEQRSSLGSGVILSSDGLLLTNRHIVTGADQIRVELADGRNLSARLVGLDPETDLAVLATDETALPSIPLGNPSALAVGDPVLAIGNPFGVGQTVTMGIVSAMGRSHLGITGIEDFIQTDASINPGNSGGALINARGELVGINTAIYSHSGRSEGVGFAIPSDLAVKVVAQLADQGKVVRGWIGISGRTVTPPLKKTFGLTTDKGVLVANVFEEGPADRAGMRPGDVIIAVNGHQLETSQGLLNVVADAGPKAKITIALLRGSKRLEVEATTSERPPMTASR